MAYFLTPSRAWMIFTQETQRTKSNGKQLNYIMNYISFISKVVKDTAKQTPRYVVVNQRRGAWQGRRAEGSGRRPARGPWRPLFRTRATFVWKCWEQLCGCLLRIVRKEIVKQHSDYSIILLSFLPPAWLYTGGHNFYIIKSLFNLIKVKYY